MTDEQAVFTNKGVVFEAIALLSSMVLSGENHSGTSMKVKAQALESLKYRLFDIDAFGDSALIEILAHVEHERWSGWIRHHFANETPENIERWKQLANTPYPALSERSKESDRREVRKTVETIIRFLTAKNG